jgi:flagellar assembly factor FliW
MEAIPLRHPLAAGTSVPAEETWDFPEGLIGFPDLKRFAVVDLEQAPPFRLLASLDEPAFGLVVVDPRSLVPDYELALTAEDVAPLGESDPERLSVLVSVILPTDAQPFSLSLRAPIVLAPTSRRGVQRPSPAEAHARLWTPESAGTGTSCSS